MQLNEVVINCQAPPNESFIKHNHTTVQCIILKGSDEYSLLMEKATALANMVNPAAANDAATERHGSRLLQDALGGVLAEAGWLQYINDEFGPIASSTPFVSATGQIDIRLSNGELAEVRSSFPRNGVQFALCSAQYNFKNIGPYANQVKAGEKQKHLYLGVLFDTQKSELLSGRRVLFSLVGGSTWVMMVENGHNVSLVPEDDFVQVRSIYKVIEFKDALDASGILKAIEALGYKRKRIHKRKRDKTNETSF